MSRKIILPLLGGVLAALTVLPAQADHHTLTSTGTTSTTASSTPRSSGADGNTSQSTMGTNATGSNMMSGNMMNHGMMGHSMMGGMGVMDDATRGYLAADTMGRNQMMNRMSLSEMVRFLKNLYQIPMTAEQLSRMGLVQFGSGTSGTMGSNIGTTSGGSTAR